MSNTHLTQCPHCQATFKVQDQHLNAAGGKVRCGSCLEVFNALENLLDSTTNASTVASQTESPQATQKSKPQSSPSDQQTAATPKTTTTTTPKTTPTTTPTTTTAELSDHQDDEDDLVFEDNPDEDSEDDGYTGPGTFLSELSDSFLDIDKNDTGHFSDSEFIEDLDANINDRKSDSDESWAEDILDDMGENEKSGAQAKKKAPIPPKQESIIEEKESFELSDEFSNLDEETPEEPISAFKNSPAFKNNEGTTPEHTLDPEDQSHSRSTDGQFSSELSSDELTQQYHDLRIDPVDVPNESSRSFFSSLIWSVLNLSLLLVLLAQFSWFNYDKLAQYEQLRPVYEKACQLIGCELPDLVDTTQIRSQNLIVRSHPTARKALIIDAVIVNQAPYDQPFPNLALYFSDLNNNIIAQRLFEPADYLAGDAKEWTEMPKRTPIHISLEIIDPGKNAVNYSVGFFKHAPQD